MEQGQPPRSVLRVVNPVVSALLRSPLHRLLSREYMLLTVTGRKTGRSYTIPVGRHEFDGAFVVYAAGGWRLNLRGGADVRLTLDGHERTGHAELEEDPARVAGLQGTPRPAWHRQGAPAWSRSTSTGRQLRMRSGQPQQDGRCDDPMATPDAHDRGPADRAGAAEDTPPNSGLNRCRYPGLRKMPRARLEPPHRIKSPRSAR